MFDSLDLSDLDAAAAADALAEVRVELIRAGARQLQLAAHWADLHSPEAAGREERRSGAGERFRRLGSDGTPEVGEFAASELGCYLGWSTAKASNLLRDALDLRHRHPRLWSAVTRGEVEDWKARSVVRATRDAALPLPAARWVDDHTISALVGLPFGPAMKVVEAKVIAADPELAEARRRVKAEAHYVGIGRQDNGFGLRRLVAQTRAGDVARIDAMVSHIAHLLGELAGPTRSGSAEHEDRDARRAEALAMLANPAAACLFLAQHGDVGAADRGRTGIPVREDGTHPEVDESESPSPVEQARIFGRLLEGLGPAALERLRPRAVLYLHLAEESLTGGPGTQVARAEGIGPVTVAQLREWLAGERISIRPVLDLADRVSVNAYEIPRRIAEQVRLRDPVEVFPYGTCESRRADLDHRRRFVPLAEGGPPGQTCADNLGPLSRRHHRVKTFGRWRLEMCGAGRAEWCTPQGHWFRVDHTGTRHLGRRTPLEEHFSALVTA